MPKKLTYEFVKEYFEKFGYKLLNEEYINCYSNLKCVCIKGHVNYISIDKLRRGYVCVECNINNKLRKRYEHITKIFKQEGCVLLSKEYINSKTKLDYTCKNGHKHSICWNDFQQGYRCIECHKHSLFCEGNPNYKGGVNLLNIPLYNTYKDQLKKYHKVVKLDVIIKKIIYEAVGVFCTYCNKVYVPKKYEVRNRLNSINGKSAGSGYFYCSEECKHKCSIYRKQEFPTGFKKNKRYAQTQWANKVKERDNYICQKCGSGTAVVAHHKIPVSVCDMLSLDVDNGVTFCINCHQEVHKKEGCTYNDLSVTN